MRNSPEAFKKSAITRKKNKDCNCFQDILLEVMAERKLSDKDVVSATGITWAVWHGWITGRTRIQMLDGNMLALSRFLNLSINYLAFGVGDSEPFYNQSEESHPPQE